MAEVKELTKKINLYDILPISKKTAGRKVVDKETIDKIQKQIDDATTVFNLYKSNDVSFNPDSDLNKKLIVNANGLRKDYFVRNYQLPKEIENSITQFMTSNEWVGGKYETIFKARYKSDEFTKLSYTPVIEVGKIKKLAMDLDMIVVPFEYLDSQSYASETYKTRNSIKSFAEALHTSFELYVLCPINHYSLSNHAKSENPNKQIFAGKHSMIFTSVLMNIPMFRSILNDLSELRDNVDVLKGTISNVKKNMEMMQLQINNLQKQVDQQKEQMLKQQIAQEAQIQSLSKKLSEMEFRVTDPVLFALPKNIDINDFNHDSMCGFVGPVWGPDFDGVALYNLDMEIIKNQRNLLNNTIDKVWS